MFGMQIQGLRWGRWTQVERLDGDPVPWSYVGQTGEILLSARQAKAALSRVVSTT